MRTFKIFTLVCLLTLCSGSIFAQEQTSALTDSFFESGKIKVVVACLGLVLAVLILYLVRLERKIRKFEKEK